MLNISSARAIFALLSRSERKGAGALLALMFVGMILETFGLGLVLPAIALFLEPDLGARYPRLQPALDALGNPTQPTLVAGAMLVLVGVYVVKTLFLWFLLWRQNRFAFGVQARLSQQLFAVYLHQPYVFHLGRNSAHLIRNAIAEVGIFTFNCVLPGLRLVTEILVVVGIGGLLLAVEPVGALVVATLIGGSSWALQQGTRRRVARWGEERRYHDALRSQRLQEGLGGVKDAKVLGRERHFLEQYRQHNARSARVEQLQITTQDVPRLLLELLAVAGLAILVLTMQLRGADTASIVRALALFAGAAFRLMPSVSRLLIALHQLRYGLPVLDVLHREFDLATHEPAARTVEATPLRNDVRLENVTYTYPQTDSPALNRVSMTIRRGETVGLIGSSGCGKSTAVDVLLGLLTPEDGRVLVDGQDVQPTLRAWQDQIGYVPQSVFLTDDTLRRNVAFGLPDDQIDDAAVRRAIAAAQLEAFVASQPNGLESLVGERGVRLSGGEHQRIGIARALYHDPAVLVLDEATSALDTTTERGVMQAVTALHGHKTILIVAHRLSTVERCDRIYRMEHGAVIEEGPPARMLAPRDVAEQPERHGGATDGAREVQT